MVMSQQEQLFRLGLQLETDRAPLAILDRYYQGTQAAAFLAPEARLALGGRLPTLSVNFARLAVTSLAERLQVIGFRLGGPGAAPDPGLWALWRASGLEDTAAQAHLDALAYGRAYIVVWADAHGDPLITVESPLQMTVARDPATRRIVAALKRWTLPPVGGVLQPGVAIFYTETAITTYSCPIGAVEDSVAAGQWTVTDVTPNPLGVVPVVEMVNGSRLLEARGRSEMADLLPLVDALGKLMVDALTTSEFAARPRRWATGLELQVDSTGAPINPFPDDYTRVWTSEAPETKFGAFPAADLSVYSGMIATLTQQIGALGALPPHYLGLVGDQPASADAIRSSEASLAARAYAKQATFGRAWAQVMALAVAVATGADPAAVDVGTVWQSPETRTVAEAADAAVKLIGAGLPLTVALSELLGWTPAQVDSVRVAQRAAALDGAGVNLAALQP